MKRAPSICLVGPSPSGRGSVQLGDVARNRRFFRTSTFRRSLLPMNGVADITSGPSGIRPPCGAQ